MEEPSLVLRQGLPDSLKHTLEASKTSGGGFSEACVSVQHISGGQSVDLPLGVDAHTVGLGTPLVLASAGSADAPHAVTEEPLARYSWKFKLMEAYSSTWKLVGFMVRSGTTAR